MPRNFSTFRRPSPPTCKVKSPLQFKTNGHHWSDHAARLSFPWPCVSCPGAATVGLTHKRHGSSVTRRDYHGKYPDRWLRNWFASYYVRRAIGLRFVQETNGIQWYCEWQTHECQKSQGSDVDELSLGQFDSDAEHLKQRHSATHHYRRSPDWWHFLNDQATWQLRLGSIRYWNRAVSFRVLFR